MTGELQGRTVAILATSGVEEIELLQPRDALAEAGARVELLSINSGEIQAMNHDVEPAGKIAVDRTVGAASVEDYDALVLPGGTTNPDQLRRDEAAVGFVRGIVAAGKPVGVICHGPWTLVEANAVRGRTLTSWPSLRTDIRNAGATVLDQEVVIDDSDGSVFVSSRGPQDLSAFCATIVEQFAAAT